MAAGRQIDRIRQVVDYRETVAERMGSAAGHTESFDHIADDNLAEAPVGLAVDMVVDMFAEQQLEDY